MTSRLSWAVMQGQKAQMKRERNAKNAKGNGASQLKTVSSDCSVG